MGQTERRVDGSGDDQLAVLCRRRSDRLVPVQPDADVRQRQQQVRHHRLTPAVDDTRCSRLQSLH